MIRGDQTNTVELELPRPYPKQREAIWHPARIVSIEASTKSGKTSGAIIWLVMLALESGREGRNYWWVAPVYSQAEIAFRRTRDMLRSAGLPERYWSANEQHKKITFKGKGTLWFKSAEKPDNLYGEDVYGAVLDEATRMREESWHAVRSTVTYTRGPIRIIGNVKGRGNWVYRLGASARNGDEGLGYARLTAEDAVEAGIFPQEELDFAKAHLPEHVYRSLYMAEPADDGGNPFGIDHIEACVGALSSEPVECWGVDLAKSVDWTVAIGLDATGAVAHFERWRATWDHTTAKVEALVGDKPALVDSSGVGDPIVERLRKACPRVDGFRFTSQSKQALMEGLAMAIQRGDIGFPDGPIREELDLFEYQATRTGVQYGAPDGQHDDCVCALALAVQCRAQQSAASYLIGGSPAYAIGPTDDDEWGWKQWN